MSSSSSRSISIALNYNLLQSIRLIHAIAEASGPIAIPPEQSWKFSVLKEAFGLEFENISASSILLPAAAVSIDHAQPNSRIGALSRTLVFPHAIAERCRSDWAVNREDSFTFTGLLTPKRVFALSKWLSNLTLAESPQVTRSVRRLLIEMQVRWNSAYGQPTYIKTPLGEVRVENNLRGRSFPGKAWDAPYLRTLQVAKFALCPNGDFVWSYRFFEAALCGAIPIVEESCPAYEGFQYYSMRDQPKTYIWRKASAENNYQLAISRLTLPKAELAEEISRLVLLGNTSTVRSNRAS